MQISISFLKDVAKLGTSTEDRGMKKSIVGSDDFGKSEINGEFLDVVTARCFCHLGLSSCAGRGR